MHFIKFVPFGALVILAKLLGLSSVWVVVLSVGAVVIYYLGIIHTDSAVREIVYELSVDRRLVK